MVSFSPELQWCFYDEYSRVVFTKGGFQYGCVSHELGGLCADQYFHSNFLPDFILIQQLDINCLELLTIIVALEL